MKELDVQRELVNSTIEAGGFGWKLNNRFMVGVADVLLKLSTFPAVIIEVKMVPAIGRALGGDVELSEHQARFLRRYQAAGGVSGWLAVGAMKRPGMYRMVTSSHIERRVYIDLQTNPYFIRDPGKPWPVGQIIELLSRQCARAEHGRSETSSVR